MSNLIEKFQNEVLQRADRIYYETPISQANKAAFMATPRHRFVSRYRNWGTREWKDVTPENLREHLPALYDDVAVILIGDDDDNVPSTISQPSFVLRML